ncbi:MAG: alanine racemase [Candidatus Ryanbacteria bacterium RIFCSPHIGHO2_12_FULL_47_12b]|uniref:Alanine racemase n=1 Tax=Candidatus Ryanbacteria bacterium RIFCSPLOWO2_02_FULL_47_14 TaxID=1802129 RepID=A0A1G2H1V6_9BACT|nr:MAG: alanine racemase [Parcubacteria group bacterium GW2011_GWA2_47_10b]KKU85478.1 MAG: alanine racemase [Parcubacteria group bacterium GW2011_GWA1_47_9]OGZ48087.1 MAG: alanine racemase [Candidatus Ryanbacteria bacterium RIFCSPHIGHO2_02_FULL_47_25]OGZ53247.1 MAG: alanine racemase [Candidatus Ryanbacteria bacterium RIFCSPHIGHO2_12_FULL_47_12b]OGZ56466.1 MAG: alanine racemase [Candidatus Ryanbacteria bacterium RIFCSPLOWO2_02_FULL_47_14]
MNTSGLRTWVEVDTAALKHNYHIFRSLISKKCALMAVTKSNAYGHSLIDFSRFMQKMGADWFGVDSVVEANVLRKNGIRKPILVLGHTINTRHKEAAAQNISVTVSTFEGLADIAHHRNQKKLKVHVKVDTGMHRQGFYNEQLPLVCETLQKISSRVQFEGLYTHFAGTKNPAFPQDTHAQFKKFIEAIDIVEGYGFNPMKHAAATYGTVVFPEAHFDMVRIGIGMYGLWPSEEAEYAFSNRIILKPALTWKTIVSEIKELPAGSRVGYDFTEMVPERTISAVCPVGYWHGYPRALSSIGNFLVKGKRAKVLGRISMDIIVIDITGIKNVHVGDEAIMVGDSMRVEEVARLASSFNYELVTRINPLIKRFYI